MRPARGRTGRTRTVGHISHAAQARVDQRVKEILARRVALDRAQGAARRLKRADEHTEREAAIRETRYRMDDS
jgi:hypothetical protein